jgi:hypothetical protein
MYEMFKSGQINPIALVTMMEALVNDIEGMVADCSDPEDVFDAVANEYVDYFHPANETLCLNNLHVEYNTFMKVLVDVNGSDYISLLTDVMQLV